LQQLANFKGAPVTRQEEQELARMALAAMKGEPVILYRERNPYNGLTTGWQELTENEFSFLKENAGENAEFVTLYRHAQPAPITEREPIAWLNDAYLARGVVDGEAGSEDAGPGYIPVYREAQSVPVVQCPFPCGWDNLNKLAIQDAALVTRGLVEGELTTEAHRQAAISNNDRLLKVISACLAAMLQAEPVKTANKLGNSPVIPDTWIPVSERMPKVGDEILYFCQEDGMKDCGIVSSSNFSGKGDKQLYVYTAWGNLHFGVEITQWMPLPASPQEATNGQ
ncbi:DUF551 domain-containing protein, partial [Klebsiella aerogenes]